jgi:hypothetical protein
MVESFGSDNVNAADAIRELGQLLIADQSEARPFISSSLGWSFR